jgi:hypothetical protein
MNYGQPLGDKCKGMDEKYRQVFIDAQNRLLEAQNRKFELVLTPGDEVFLRSIGVQIDSNRA